METEQPDLLLANTPECRSHLAITMQQSRYLQKTPKNMINLLMVRRELLQRLIIFPKQGKTAAYNSRLRFALRDWCPGWLNVLVNLR
jgi:hypothetical protein